VEIDRDRGAEIRLCLALRRGGQVVGSLSQIRLAQGAPAPEKHSCRCCRITAEALSGCCACGWGAACRPDGRRTVERQAKRQRQD
jgi:hypothetical protein